MLLDRSDDNGWQHEVSRPIRSWDREVKRWCMVGFSFGVPIGIGVGLLIGKLIGV